MDTIFTRGHQLGIHNGESRALRVETEQGIFKDGLHNLPAAQAIFDHSFPQFEHATIDVSLRLAYIDDMNRRSVLFVLVELRAAFLRYLPGDWKRQSTRNPLPGRLYAGNSFLFLLARRASATPGSCT